MERECFLIYKSFYEPIKLFNNEQLGRLFRAIFEYQISQNENVDNDIRIAFEFFKNQFRLDNLKYEKICERNKKNGLKGGRPKKNKENPKNPMGIIKPKKADNDNDNDNDNENNNNIIIRDSFEKNESKTQNNNEIIKEIVNYLNTCGEYEKFEKVIKFRYKYTSNYIRKIITARINEGYNIEDFKDVIFNCYKKFVVNEFIGLNNKSSIQYYNPEVMFTSEKMVKYLNEYDSIR